MNYTVKHIFCQYIFVGTFGVQNMYDICAHNYYYSVVQIWEQK